MAEEKMHAVVIYGKEDFRYEEVPKPKPREEEVLVRIGKCGICAADPKIYHGKAYFSKIAYSYAPIIAGHEFVGEVVELGPGAKEKYGLDIGDKAIMEHIIPCRECYYCKRGLYNLCVNGKVPGVVGINGGWAEYMLYPKGSIIHKLPDKLSWKEAVLTEPLACAVHGVERVGVGLNDNVVIIGDGPIGLLMLEVVMEKNPNLVIVAGHHDSRLRIAKDIGADIIINSKKEDVVERVKAETDGIGADVVLEAAGSPSAVREAVDMLRKRGRLLIYGVYAEEAAIDWSIISDIKELEIYGGHLAPFLYPVAIKLLAEGKVDADRIVTHDFPLKEWRKAIETAEKRIGGAIKVAMTP